jgi:hypothetical protein
MPDKIFASGFFFKKPSDKAPSFIIGNASFKVDEFSDFLQTHMDAKGYVNIVIKESQKGTVYGELDKWEPKKQDDEKVADDINPDDVPF